MRRAISAGCLAALGVWLAAAVLTAYETVTAPQEPTPEPVIEEPAPSQTIETADEAQSVRLSTADGVETLALDDYLTGVVMGGDARILFSGGTGSPGRGGPDVYL